MPTTLYKTFLKIRNVRIFYDGLHNIINYNYLFVFIYLFFFFALHLRERGKTNYRNTLIGWNISQCNYT